MLCHLLFNVDIDISITCVEDTSVIFLLPMTVPLLFVKAILICSLRIIRNTSIAALQWRTETEIFTVQYTLDIGIWLTYVNCALIVWEESYLPHKSQTEKLISDSCGLCRWPCKGWPQEAWHWINPDTLSTIMMPILWCFVYYTVTVEGDLCLNLVLLQSSKKILQHRQCEKSEVRLSGAAPHSSHTCYVLQIRMLHRPFLIPSCCMNKVSVKCSHETHLKASSLFWHTLDNHHVG